MTGSFFQVFILGQLGILLECQVHVKILSVGELARAIHSFAQRGYLPYQRPTGGLPLPLRPPSTVSGITSPRCGTSPARLLRVVQKLSLID